MKSFEQLAEVAYNDWHQTNQTSPRFQVPFKDLTEEHKARWISLVRKVHAEIEALH